jgi:hypothetical protein
LKGYEVTLLLVVPTKKREIQVVTIKLKIYLDVKQQITDSINISPTNFVKYIIPNVTISGEEEFSTF